MIKYLTIAVLFYLGSLFSAIDPLDKIYNESTLSSDLREILAHDTPDSSAYQGITQYLLVMAFSEEQLVGKTYREILELSRIWALKQQIRETQEKALAEQADLEQQKRYESMRKVVEVALDSQEVIELDSVLSTTYHFTIINHANKSIKSVEGLVEINDDLHAYFTRLDRTFAEPLSGHSARREKVNFIASKEFNQPQKGPNEPGKLIWRPEKISFADGSVLE